MNNSKKRRRSAELPFLIPSKQAKLGDADYLEIVPVEIFYHIFCLSHFHKMTAMLSMTSQGGQRMAYALLGQLRTLDLQQIPGPRPATLDVFAKYCHKVDHIVYSAKAPGVSAFQAFYRQLPAYGEDRLRLTIPDVLLRQNEVKFSRAYVLFRSDPRMATELMVSVAAINADKVPVNFCAVAPHLKKLEMWGRKPDDTIHMSHAGAANKLEVLKLSSIVIAAGASNPFFNQPPPLEHLLLNGVKGLESTDFWPLVAAGAHQLQLLQLAGVSNLNCVLPLLPAGNIEQLEISKCPNIEIATLVAFLNRCHKLACFKMDTEMDANALRYMEQHLQMVADKQRFALCRFIASRYWSDVPHKDVRRSIEWLDRYLETNDRNAVIWADKGRLLGHFNDQFDAAIACLDRATQLDPGNQSAWATKAAYLEHVRQFQRAADECYPHTLKTLQDWRDAVSKMVNRAREDASLVPLLMTLCDKAVSQFPDDLKLLEIKGCALLRFRLREEEGEAICRRVIELEPTTLLAYSSLGTTLARRKCYEESIEMLKTVVNVNAPGMDNAGRASLHFAMAGSFGALKRDAEALQSINSAIALVPRKAEYHFKKAEVLIGMRRFAEALFAIDIGLELRPDYEAAQRIRRKLARTQTK